MAKKFKLFVCINQCFPPDSNTESKTIYEQEPSLTRGFNYADRCALEEALRIKKSFEAVEVTSALVGAPELKWILRASLGLGADEAVHFFTDPEKYYDSYQIALALSEYIARGKYDLVLCSYGKERDNYETGPLGPILAELLQYPFISEAASVNIDLQNKFLTVRRKLTKGNRLEIETSLPAVLAVSSTLNEPRYISIRKKNNPVHIKVKKENVISSSTQLTELLSISPLKPRPKQIEIAGGSLPVQERLDFIISGGSSVRKRTILMEGRAAELCNELLNYLEKENIL